MAHERSWMLFVIPLVFPGLMLCGCSSDDPVTPAATQACLTGTWDAEFDSTGSVKLVLVDEGPTVYVFMKTGYYEYLGSGYHMHDTRIIYIIMERYNEGGEEVVAHLSAMYAKDVSSMQGYFGLHHCLGDSLEIGPAFSEELFTAVRRK